MKFAIKIDVTASFEVEQALSGILRQLADCVEEGHSIPFEIGMTGDEVGPDDLSGYSAAIVREY
jgi:hypothetical protein